MPLRSLFAGLLLLPSLATASNAAPIPWQPPSGDGGVADAEAPVIAAGYAALFTCSATFIAGRPLDAILARELHDLAPLGLSRPVLDRGAGLVEQVWADDQPPRRAAFRPGMGCTLLPVGAPRSAVVDLPFARKRPAPTTRAATPWPDGDAVPPLPALPALEAVVARAFDGSSFAAGNRSNAVMVLQGGRVLAERYAPGYGPDVAYRTWSTAKSMAAALIGVLVGQGRLDLDAPAPIPEWAHPDDPRQAITLRDLLHMQSGLVSGGNNTYTVYFGGAAGVSAITDTALEEPPGSRWKYANNDTLLLVHAMRQVIGDDLAYLRFPWTALFERIGMHSTVPEIDHQGLFIMSSQVWTTPRDLARFALLHLNDGVWNGAQVLPSGWAAFVCAESPTRGLDREQWGYGAQWWLLGNQPGLPRDTCTTAGNKGQYATIIPSRDLVVVRTGVDPNGVRFDHAAFLAEVLKALSGKR